MLIKKNKIAGFTLIELLVVIGVLGVLVTGIVIAVNPAQQLAKARDSARKSSLKQIRGALDAYRIAYGTYPITGGWIASTQPGWQTFLGSELKTVPVDPSQNGTGCSWPWVTASCSWFAYYSATGATYDLVTQLENRSDPDRCEIKQWNFQAAGASWCGAYSIYIYAPGPDQ
jgi:prepilin-type N-terminal cleavage/methylation domain-containing protein